jgi:peptidoglycan/xylan/chitin deacetylase (PgdA/CDA1 family)
MNRSGGSHLIAPPLRGRGFKTAIALALVSSLATPATARPTIAITVDDLPAHGPLPAGASRLDIAGGMIGTLLSQNVPATGFVNGSFGADDPNARLVLLAWKAARLPLGNHSFSHWHLNEVGADAFVAGQPRRFRYPFLEEGSDPTVRDAARKGLARRGYRIAAVTLSFDDYAYNAPYVRCLAQGDDKAVAALEARYLESARVDAARARTITRATLGRDVPHVLLLHIGVFTSRMLPRLIDLYRGMGFGFVALDQAQKDPFYAAVDPRKPGPSPTMDALAKQMATPPPAKLPIPGDEVCPAT